MKPFRRTGGIMKKKMMTASMLAWAMLFLGTPGTSAARTIDSHIDQTVDNSKSYVTGFVHITGSGGTQAGYSSKKTIYNNESKVTYSNPKPAAVQSMINEAYNNANFLASKCKASGKSGEYHMSTTSTEKNKWDSRKYEIIYSAWIGGEYCSLKYDHDEGSVTWYKKEDGTLISNADYEISRVHIASGDYGRITYYEVAATGWVSGFDITVTSDGHGTGSSDPAVSLSGETVKLNAVPAAGYKFKTWEVVSGGVVPASATSSSTTFMMPAADTTIKATFEPVSNDQGQPSSGTETDTWGNVLVSEQQMENMILGMQNDNDMPGSSFSLLQATAKKVKKNAITYSWKSVPGAASYTVYGNKCGKGNKYLKLETVSGTSYTYTGLKKGTYYKVIVVANGGGKARAVSKTVHAATAGGKAGNHKSVQITGKKSLTIKKGKTVKIKAKAIPKDGKQKVSIHKKLAFETGNPKIATVDRNGKVKAVGKGKCTIFVYAQNGVFTKINVKVK